jgi:hypothetical protein
VQNTIEGIALFFIVNLKKLHIYYSNIMLSKFKYIVIFFLISNQKLSMLIDNADAVLSRKKQEKQTKVVQRRPTRKSNRLKDLALLLATYRV